MDLSALWKKKVTAIAPGVLMAVMMAVGVFVLFTRSTSLALTGTLHRTVYGVEDVKSILQ